MKHALVSALMSAALSASATTVRIVAPPEDQAWARKAAAVVGEWVPRIEAALGVSAVSNRVVTLHFKDMPGVAHTAGDTITISSAWIRQRPDDLGMVVHELVHVIQAYPGGQPGWMVEGIADHVRYFMYEPAVGAAYKPGIGGQDYRVGYLPAAAFLDWLDRRTEGNLVQELNALARAGRLTEAALVEKAGAPLDDLWKEFVSGAR